MFNSVLTKKQEKVLTKKKDGIVWATATIRYDDRCGNGHNTFSITGDIQRHGFCGAHDEIVEVFPELKPYIKWHLCSSDEPLHYLANTIYLASDRDHNGLRKGEVAQILAGGKTPVWQLCYKSGDVRTTNVKVDGIERYITSHTCPESPGDGLCYVPFCRVGEGKEPDIEAAKGCAMWPDATLEQLQDKKALEERLPDLMKEFKKDVESLGFVW